MTTKTELKDLHDADPQALEAIMLYLEKKNPPPVVNSLHAAQSLLDPKTALDFAFKAGRASIIGDIKSVIALLEA